MPAFIKDLVEKLRRVVTWQEFNYLLPVLAFPEARPPWSLDEEEIAGSHLTLHDFDHQLEGLAFPQP